MYLGTDARDDAYRPEHPDADDDSPGAGLRGQLPLLRHQHSPAQHLQLHQGMHLFSLLCPLVYVLYTLQSCESNILIHSGSDPVIFL